MRSSRLVFPIFLGLLLGGRPAATTPRGSDLAEFCCFRYSTKTLPWSWVRSYELTRSSCAQQAVIFTTKRGKKVCVQLKEKWVEKYISLLKTQKQL